MSVFILAIICRYLQPLWLAYINFPLQLTTLVIMQAVIAAGLCVVFKTATWWRWIHAGFPLAIYAMYNINLPHEIYLVGFLLSTSLFWTTFRSQVPFFPSRPVVWQQVAGLIPAGKAINIIDIGSGLGDLAMHVAAHHPNSQVTGIEIAPLPWLISKVRAKIARSRAKFTLGNFYELNFKQYDVVFAYLSPAAMASLWNKAQAEMRAGSMLISYEFDIPGVMPSYAIGNGQISPILYVWKIP